MKRTLWAAVVGFVLLSLLTGLWVQVRRSLAWRAEATQTLTRERERFSQQERIVVARLEAALVTADSLQSQLATANTRVARATGHLLSVRDSLRLATTMADSLDEALTVIDLQDSVIIALEDEVETYRISDEVIQGALLLSMSRTDSLTNRIVELEYVLGRAPLLQPSPSQRKLFGLLPHPGDGWLVAGTALLTLTLQAVAR